MEEQRTSNATMEKGTRCTLTIQLADLIQQDHWGVAIFEKEMIADIKKRDLTIRSVRHMLKTKN